MSSETQGTPESTLSIDLLTWFEENKKTLAIAVAVAVVVAVVVIVYRNHKSEGEEKASKDLVMLVASETNGAIPSGDKLQEIARNHSGTKAADRAQYLAGVKLFEDGKYADAQTQFESLANHSPDSPLAPQAALGVAAALEAQNKTADALSAYARFVAGSPNDSLAPQAKLAQARILESQGKAADALAIYKTLTQSNAGYAREAVARQAYLLQQHPELIPAPASVTNAVKVAAPGSAGLPTLSAPTSSGTPSGK